MIINRKGCPFCESKQIKKVLASADYSNTKQVFDIWECDTCTGRFTQSIPDEHSIAPYYQFENYISHNNEAKGFVNKIYLRARKFTLRKKVLLIKSLVSKPTINIVDIGAGVGAFVHQCNSSGYQAIGYEPDAQARTAAKQSFGIDLLASHEWFSNNNTYDVITLWHVMEHLHELQLYMQSFHKNLDAHGAIVIAVPNYKSSDAAYYQDKWAAYDVPRHLYHFSPTCMKMFAEKNGFVLESMKRMWLDGYYVSILSEKHKGASLSFIKGMFQGLITHIQCIFNKEKVSSMIYILRKK